MRTTPLVRGVVVAGVAALAVVPFMGLNRFWVFFITVTLLQTMLLASLNLSLGYAGLVSLGHNALFAIGGYATAYFTTVRGVPPLAGVALGMAFGVAAGVTMALPALRARAVYFGIITLAFLFLTFETVSKWPALGGFRGIPGVPALSVAGRTLDTNGAYWLALGIFVLSFAVLQQLSASAVGRAFVAVRENEAAAASVGVNVFATKMLNLAVSGGLAGLAGALFAHLSGGIFPESASFQSGIRLFVAIVVGGVGTFAGPLVGMGMVAAVDRFTVNWTTAQPILFGLMLLVSLAVLRAGVVGTVLLGRFRPLFLRLRPMDVDASVSRPVETLVEARETPDGPMLRVSGVVKRFGGVVALDGVDLEVEAGEIHGLIGPNGSGKSTLVNVLSGMMRRDAGRIEFAGAEAGRPTPHRMARAGLVRIFQRTEPFGRLLVVQNVLCGLHLRADRHLLRSSIPWPARRRQEAQLGSDAVAILAALGLADRALSPVTSLPHGEQRLLEIARAIAARPRLLVLDEPATGLTASELERLAAVLAALRRGGLTILLIEHNMDFLMGLADRVSVLDAGRRIATGTPGEIQRHPDVLEAYLGEAVSA